MEIFQLMSNPTSEKISKGKTIDANVLLLINEAGTMTSSSLWSHDESLHTDLIKQTVRLLSC